MAFPETIDPAAPADTDSPSLGDDQFRALKQFLVDVLGLPSSPTAVAAAATKMDSTGQWPSHVRLTNKTGVALAAGDVVGLDAANNSAVTLVDVASTQKPLVVVRETIANNAAGLFVNAGVIDIATTGSSTRGNYLVKSVTTKVAADSGIAIGDTISPPAGAFAVALETGTTPVTAFLLSTGGGGGAGGVDPALLWGLR